MIRSLVLTLTTGDDPAFVPQFLGRASHALFLTLVAEADPALAQSLHDDDGLKPFTVSTLLGPDPLQGQPRKLWPGQSYALRFTSLLPELSRVLQEQAPAWARREVDLDGAGLRIVGATCDPAVHPLAGQARYEELAQRWLIDEVTPPGAIGLTFTSPTTFRSQQHNLPLPLPGLVFGSLLERWNRFAPVRLNPDVRRYAEECLAISRYHLETRLVVVAGGKQVGFCGTCSYVALNHDAYWLRQVNLLADFARYSGVGYKTTMGLGQVARVAESRQRD